MPKDQVNDARKVCRECPVWMDCLVSSIDYDEDYGVWAALTPEERRRAQAATVDIWEIFALWRSGDLFAMVVLR
jgi:hypothetical protein